MADCFGTVRKSERDGTPREGRFIHPRQR